MEIDSTNFDKLILWTNSHNMWITTCYRSTSSNVKNFIRDLCELPTNEKCDKQNIEIFTGDINRDLLEEDFVTNEFFNILNEFGYTK